ncbi:MAG TPA: response regulator, partial [Calditrichae bacterium]|nr:response regulator [Calditrichia bacterium]
MATQDKNYRALIVDDEYYLGQILAQALTHDGIEAVAVTDVDTALSHLQQESFDIVISDIYLPGKTGVDLFHTAMQKFPEIPFIFMTGNPDLEMAVDFLKKGGYDYIVKPFMIPDFIKKVNHVIQRSNQRRQEQHLVSDLKQILNKRLQELRIFQDIIESSTDGLIVTDTEGIIVKTNMGL